VFVLLWRHLFSQKKKSASCAPRLDFPTEFHPLPPQSHLRSLGFHSSIISALQILLSAAQKSKPRAPLLIHCSIMLNSDRLCTTHCNWPFNNASRIGFFGLHPWSTDISQTRIFGFELSDAQGTLLILIVSRGKDWILYPDSLRRCFDSRPIFQLSTLSPRSSIYSYFRCYLEIFNFQYGFHISIAAILRASFYKGTSLTCFNRPLDGTLCYALASIS